MTVFLNRPIKVVRLPDVIEDGMVQRNDHRQQEITQFPCLLQGVDEFPNPKTLIPDPEFLIPRPDLAAHGYF